MTHNVICMRPVLLRVRRALDAKEADREVWRRAVLSKNKNTSNIPTAWQLVIRQFEPVVPRTKSQETIAALQISQLILPPGNAFRSPAQMPNQRIELLRRGLALLP